VGVGDETDVSTTRVGGAPRAPIPHTRVSLYVGIRRYADAYLSYA